MRLRTAGSASFQTLSLIFTVALAGLAGFGSIGRSFDRAVATGASGSATESAVSSNGRTTGIPSAPLASQAGIFSAIRSLASAADDGAVARRLLGAADETSVARRISGDVAAISDNPLTRRGIEVDWDLVRPEHVEPAIEGAIARATAQLDEAGRWRFRPTYAQTVTPISEAIDEIHFVNGALSHLTTVLDDQELAEAFARVQPRVEAFMHEAFRREDVKYALNRFANSKNAGELDSTRAMYLRSLRSSFDQGSNIPEALQQRVLAIQTELGQLELEFDRNMAAAHRDFEVIITDEKLLEGMSPKGLEILRASAESVGKPGYRFTMGDGTVGFGMYRSPNAQLRETVWRAVHSIGATEEGGNRVVVNRILSLRRELAQTYGLPSYADMAVQGRMVGSAYDAQKFLIDLAEKTTPAAANDLAELRSIRMQLEGIEEINPWDYHYFDRIRRQHVVGDLDTSAYLTVDDTLTGAFKVAERLFGVRTEEIVLPKWHSDVRSFRVIDEDGRVLGNLQMDLFERAGKRSGAWQMEIHQGEGPRPSLGILATNFGAPEAGQVARLSIDEAQTLFHEFGHALHLLFSDVEVRAFGGNRVTRDFVELPSQLMENWVWEKEALDMFARHADTGEPMSAEVYEKLLAARKYGAANEQMHQLGLAFMDLALHRQWDPATKGDAVDYAREVMQMFSPTQLPDDYAQVLTFRHIFSGGYGAGYYGYKWAEVLEADAFSRFRAEGVLSRDAGNALRQSILSKGKSKSAADLFREFMGRAPDPAALLKRLGLIDDEPTPNNVVPMRRPAPPDTAAADSIPEAA